MNNFYLLSNVDYDYEEKFFLEGPPDMTEEQFEKLCHDLIEEAGILALQTAQTTPSTLNDGSVWYNMVNSSEIMMALVKLLETRGFKEFRPKHAFASGFYIGQMEHYERDSKPDPDNYRQNEIFKFLGEAHKLICEWNQQLWDFMHKDEKHGEVAERKTSVTTRLGRAEVSTQGKV